MNSVQFCYDKEAHLQEPERYAGTTSVYVVAPETFDEDVWQSVQDRGSEVLEYSIAIERPNSNIRAFQYMGDPSKVPLWPYLTSTGQQRSENSYTLLTDIRVGSPWVTWYVEEYLASRQATGHFFDGLGGQLFSSAGWDSWPQGERDEWTAGAVDLLRRAREVAPTAILVCNNHWDKSPIAETYCDGIVCENHVITATAPQLAWKRILGKPYGTQGRRRVFTISPTDADALLWAAVPGVTHVCSTQANTSAGRPKYAYATKPVVGYSDLRVPYPDLSGRVAELEAELTLVKAQLAGSETLVRELYALRAAAEISCSELQSQLDYAKSEYATVQQQLNRAKAAHRELNEALA